MYLKVQVKKYWFDCECEHKFYSSLNDISK